MSDPIEIWELVTASGHAHIAQYMDPASLEPLVARARTDGALVTTGAFDPVAAGVGLGPLASVVGDLLADIPPGTPALKGDWVQPALDDLSGRSDLRRDLAEIYSAVKLVVELAAQRRPVLIALEGIDWASRAIRNLLAYLESDLDAPVLIACARAAATRDLAPDAHRAIAEELETNDRARTEPELIGAHLAQAISGDPDTDPETARRAATWLARAAAVAVDRSDLPSAANLFARATALLPPSDPERLRYVADSCEALLATGRAQDIADLTSQAIDEARSVNESCIEARLRVWQLMVDESITADNPPIAELRSLGETLASCGDDVGSAQVHEALAHIAWITNDESQAIDEMRKGLAAANRARARTPLSRLSVSYLSIVASGSTPVGEAIRAFELVGPIALHSSFVEISLKSNAAMLFALVGHFDVARDELGDAEMLQAALHQPPWVARVPRVAAVIELLDGNPSGAVERGGAGLDELVDMGHPAGVDAGLVVARALCELRHFEHAADLARRLSEALRTNPTSEAPEIGEGEIAGVLARALAGIGKTGEADSAVARSDASPPPVTRLVQAADRLMDTARAYITLDRTDDAKTRIGKAIELYKAKGATLPETLARTLL